MRSKLAQYLDDIFVLLGCICILIGLGMWSIPLALVVCGMMLVAAGVLYGKRLSDVDQ